MRRWAVIASLAAGLLSLPAAAAPEFPDLANAGFKDCDAALGAAVCRLRHDLTSDEAAARLSGRDRAWWVEGDTFNVVAQKEAKQLGLCCAIQGPMARLPGTDYWTLSARVRDLDRAVIDVGLLTDTRPADAEWRGPQAPPRAQHAQPLKGRIVAETVRSRHLGAKRELWIYLPPGYVASARYPVVYAADGGSVPIAETVEPLILAGKVRPMVIVGVESGGDEQRSVDYLRNFNGKGDEGFARHEAFFLQEVVPLAETKWGASPRPADRLVIGQSSGAAWALATALRNPAAFPQAAVLSLGWPPNGRGLGGPLKPRLFLAAGTLEGNFHKRTREIAQAARTAGHDVSFVSRVSGHSPSMWQDLYPQVAEWAFPAR
jgi:enterochelin esterase-like enzyme